MFNLFKKKKKEFSIEALCPYKIKPERERYKGICDRCDCHKWKQTEDNYICICNHLEGNKEQIKTFEEHINGDYYEHPKTCPIFKNKKTL